jgi:hypothetical protein
VRWRGAAKAVQFAPASVAEANVSITDRRDIITLLLRFRGATTYKLDRIAPVHVNKCANGPPAFATDGLTALRVSASLLGFLAVQQSLSAVCVDGWAP